MALTATSDGTVSTVPQESSSSAIRWGAILAGAFAASTLTLILMLLGSGLGLGMASPWSGDGAGLTTFAVSTAIWLIIVQWFSAGVGGYLAGRLRTKWVNVHTDEVFFRDTAHGFLAWAVATLLVVGLLGSAISSVVGSGVQAAAAITSGAASAASTGASAAADNPTVSGTTSYFVDSLFRPADASRLSAPGAEGDATAAAQATSILAESVVEGKLADEDKTYLTQLVAARTGVSEADATARVDALLTRVEEAKTKAVEAADTARTAAASFALFGSLSLLIGAFIAAAAAALAGSQRGEDDAVALQVR